MVKVQSWIGSLAPLGLLLAACLPNVTLQSPRPSPMGTAETVTHTSTSDADRTFTNVARLQFEPRPRAAEMAMNDWNRRDDVAQDFAPAPNAIEASPAIPAPIADIPSNATSTPGPPVEGGKTAPASSERAAIEALDRLALHMPIFEDHRGKFIRLESDELFAPGQSQLSPVAGVRLDDVAAALRNQSDRRIVVQAFTDSLGPPQEADRLSLERAEAVRRYLIDRNVPADRLRAEGLGAKRPIAENATAEGRARNRRVEIVIRPRGGR